MYIGWRTAIQQMTLFGIFESVLKYRDSQNLKSEDLEKGLDRCLERTWRDSDQDNHGDEFMRWQQQDHRKNRIVTKLFFKIIFTLLHST